MYRLVDERRAVHVVELICAVLQIAPSAYRRQAHSISGLIREEADLRPVQYAN